MRTDSIPTIYRQDYTPYPVRLPEVGLAFDLDATATRVHTTLRFEAVSQPPQPLVLHGEDLELVSVAINQKPLQAGDYTLSAETLTLIPPARASSFTVDIVSICRPADNTSLMGLYVSGDKLFTPCEAQGFRRITWFRSEEHTSELQSLMRISYAVF